MAETITCETCAHIDLNVFPRGKRRNKKGGQVNDTASPTAVSLYRWNTIPTELQDCVISFCGIEELRNLCLVSRNTYSMASRYIFSHVGGGPNERIALQFLRQYMKDPELFPKRLLGLIRTFTFPISILRDEDTLHRANIPNDKVDALLLWLFAHMRFLTHFEVYIDAAMATYMVRHTSPFHNVEYGHAYSSGTPLTFFLAETKWAS